MRHLSLSEKKKFLLLAAVIITGSICLLFFSSSAYSFNESTDQLQAPSASDSDNNKSSMPEIKGRQAKYTDYLPRFISSFLEDKIDVTKIPSKMEPGKMAEELSILLDGRSGYISVPDSPSLNTTSKFTIEAWIKTTQTGKAQGILEKSEPNAAGYSLSLSSDLKLLFRTKSTRQEVRQENLLQGASVVSPNEWHHIACVFDGTAIYIFLDGQLDVQQKFEGNFEPNSGELKIGLIRDEKNRKVFFEGLMDEVRISNTVRYSSNFQPETRLYGGGFFGLTAGCWRFSDQKTEDSTGNDNHGVIKGNVTFVKDPFNELEPESDAGSQSFDTQASPLALINFDNVDTGTPLHNVYPGISFLDNNGAPMFAIHNCTPSGPCAGQSKPNFAGTFGQYVPAVFNFSQPVNITKFKAIGIDYSWGVIARVGMKQDNQYYLGFISSNGTNVPVDVPINSWTCGNEPCNRVTQIVVYNISDPLGLGFDDLVYTPYTSPTPNPTPNCRGADDSNPEAAPCPGATPTPDPNQIPNPPTGVFAQGIKGEVRISWNWGASVANPSRAEGWKIYRSDNSGGPYTFLGTSRDNTTLSYYDSKTDIKIGTDKYYKVSSYNIYGESSLSAPVGGAPLSACDQPERQPSPPINFNGLGWAGTYKFEHGFSATNVSLSGRLMAVHMGVASVTTSYFDGTDKETTLDLDNVNSQQGWLSKLIGYGAVDTGNMIGHWASYCVSSPTGQESYKVGIEYRFAAEKPKDPCEPTSGLPCARFWPLVFVQYSSGQGFDISIEQRKKNVQNFRAKQRLHYRENNSLNNVVSFIQDCDTSFIGYPNGCTPFEFPIAKKGTTNPVKSEYYLPLFSTRKKVGQAARYIDRNAGNILVTDPRGYPDNMHQASGNSISLPGPFNNDDFSAAGCPTCVHSHWRWTSGTVQGSVGLSNEALADGTTFSGRHTVGGNYLNTRKIGSDFFYESSPDFSTGRELYAFGAVTKYFQEEFGLLNPPINGHKIYNDVRANSANVIPARGDDIVLWYDSAIGLANIKLVNHSWAFTEVFNANGGFFQPVREHNKELNSVNDVNSTIGGYPTKVFAQYYFKLPSSTVPQQVNGYFLSNSSAGNMPPGYTRLDESVYKVSVAAPPSLLNFFAMQQATAGNQVIRYKVVNPAVNFNTIRLMHSEKDDVEPEVRKLIDRTITSGPYAPDPVNKIISAQVSSLGVFTLATYNPAQVPVPEASTDLKLTGNVSPASIPSGNTATYSFNILNQGGANAENVVLIQDLGGLELISATPSTGLCHTGSGEPFHRQLHDHTGSQKVYCKVGNIGPGGSVSVTLVTGTVLFGDGVETAPVPVASDASVTALEADTNPADNNLTLTFNSVPSPNKPPTSSISNPTPGAVFVTSSQNPVTIPITIGAADADGSIAEVTVYDGTNLIGTATPAGGGNYTINLTTAVTGYHSISAVAKDNGNRVTNSAAVQIIVNSPHTVSIVKPTQQLIAPGSDIVIETQSSLAGNRIQKIEIFDQGSPLGILRAVSNTGNLYKHRFTLSNAPRGNHLLTAILTDLTGAITISQPFSFKVTTLPTVAITAPGDSASFPVVNSVDITVQVGDSDGYVKELKFYASGILIGSKTESIVSGATTYKWLGPQDGVYSLVVSVTDDTDETVISAPVNIGINRQPPSIGEMVWVDDNLPSGATTGGNDGWNWMNISPMSLLGNVAHQSILMSGEHEHYFENSTLKLQLGDGEQLSAWVFIDPGYVPAEIMLQWKDDVGWEHRAYWGQNLINLGTNGTDSRRYKGDIPATGRWVQLKVPASEVGLEGKFVNGMKFTLHGGRAAWDRVGKLLSTRPNPPPQEPDFVWIDDAPPAGSLLEAVHDTWTDNTWINFNPSPQSGSLAHKHWTNDFNEPYRQHSFRNAPTTMNVAPGDTLYAYVYLYPDAQYQPDTLVLQWYDDTTGWGHRAYWGRDILGNLSLIGIPNAVKETEYWRHMGPMPPLGQWTRLEIPASYVGAEGKQLKGMAFGIYQKGKKGRAVWDTAGKTSAPPQNPVRPLRFTAPLYRFRCDAGYPYYVYSTNKDYYFYDINCQQHSELSAFIYSYPPPATIALRAFVGNTSLKRIYGVGTSYPGHTFEGIVGYVPASGPWFDAVTWNNYSCNNSNYYTTYPLGPDTIFPSGCTFLGTTCPVHSTGYAP